MAIGGVATAGALLVSLILLRQQMRDQRRARNDRRIEHASQISFWLGLQQVQTKKEPVYAPDAPDATIVAHFMNLSTQPAMSPLILVGVRSDLWQEARADAKEEVEEATAEWSAATAIGPGDNKAVPLTVPLPERAAILLAEYREQAIIGKLHFTDASGVDWVRTSGGKLIEGRSARLKALIPLSLSQRHDRLRMESAVTEGPRPQLPGWLRDYLARRET